MSHSVVKRYTHLNLSGSNHSILDAETAAITGTLSAAAVVLNQPVTASQVGEMRYNGTSFSFEDAIGVYDPRSSGSLPTATSVGQVLYSENGSIFTAEVPLTAGSGWLVNGDGILLVV